MKFVSALTDAQRASLAQLHRHGSVHRLRQRAQAVLLSAKGFTREQIACACEVHTETISGWLNQWQQKGLAGLADAPKPGRPRKIDVVLEAELLDLLTQRLTWCLRLNCWTCSRTPRLPSKLPCRRTSKKRQAHLLAHREALPA